MLSLRVMPDIDAALEYGIRGILQFVVEPVDGLAVS